MYSKATMIKDMLSDRTWRLNNLYWIIDKNGQKTKFKMNWAQEALFQDFWYCTIVLKARQLGISTFICMLFLDACLFESNKSAGIICHTREDSEMMFKRVKYAYDNLPEAIRNARSAKINSARELVFSNGSSIRTGTSMRGTTLNYLLISEFGKICAKYLDKAQEIITGSLNTLARGQYVVIESTAEGREGYFYDLCKRAEKMEKEKVPLSELDFRFFFFPWWKEPTYRIGNLSKISLADQNYFKGLEEKGIELDDQQKSWYVARKETQGENIFREYPSTAEEAWESAIDGSYFSRQISEARADGRISRVPYDQSLPVYTAWDLGYDDPTAIWFFQVYRKEIRLIEYLEGSGESLTHWLNIVQKKPYTYAKHFAPHDIRAHEYSTGTTRQAVARQLGVSLIASPQTEIIEGIDAVRLLLPRCWFDEHRCANGVKALENYKKEWNDRYGCWATKPLHNWASHGADAFRVLALSIRSIESPKEDQVFSPRINTPPWSRQNFF